MTEGDFRNSLKRAHDLFHEFGLIRVFTMPLSLGVNAEFNAVALDKDCSYPDVYFKGLKLAHYNFQLRDYSYFQFSHTSPDNLRYAFYPSPFGNKQLANISKLTAALDEGALDFETYCVAIEGLEINYRRPLIRYDYSSEQYLPVKHPTSHLHLGTFGEDRWPLERRLTPIAFALLIAKLFFGEYWEAVTDETTDSCRTNEFDNMLIAEKALCAITPIEKFLDVERNMFFIA